MSNFTRFVSFILIISLLCSVLSAALVEPGLSPNSPLTPSIKIEKPNAVLSGVASPVVGRSLISTSNSNPIKSENSIEYTNSSVKKESQGIVDDPAGSKANKTSSSIPAYITITWKVVQGKGKITPYTATYPNTPGNVVSFTISPQSGVPQYKLVKIYRAQEGGRWWTFNEKSNLEFTTELGRDSSQFTYTVYFDAVMNLDVYANYIWAAGWVPTFSYHTYTVLTYKDGTRHYFRAGPSTGYGGKIVTDYGLYVPGTVDYRASPKIFNVQSDISENTYKTYYQNMARRCAYVKSLKVDYDKFGPNSNTVCRLLIASCNTYGFKPGVWTPGWGSPLK